MNLIIVESPTKAKTLSKFLGKDYIVEATLGHIKDLPKSKLSVDTEHNFEPDYQEVPRQGKNINILKKAAKKADAIFLATDPDREGGEFPHNLHGRRVLGQAPELLQRHPQEGRDHQPRGPGDHEVRGDCGGCSGDNQGA